MVFSQHRASSAAPTTANPINAEPQAKRTTTSDSVSISFQAYSRLQSDQQDESSGNTHQNKGDINRLKYGDLDSYENLNFMEKVRQAMIDKRMGLDREKVEEINEKMEIIIKDESIPAEEKEQLLKQLAKAKDAEYEKAAKRTEEQAKSAASNKQNHVKEIS